MLAPLVRSGLVNPETTQRRLWNAAVCFQKVDRVRYLRIIFVWQVVQLYSLRTYIPCRLFGKSCHSIHCGLTFPAGYLASSATPFTADLHFLQVIWQVVPLYSLRTYISCRLFGLVSCSARFHYKLTDRERKGKTLTDMVVTKVCYHQSLCQERARGLFSE